MSIRRSRGPARETTHGDAEPFREERETPDTALLTPTDADVAALDRLRRREHARAYGMAIVAAVLFEWVAPFVPEPYSNAVMIAAGLLFLYSLVSRFEPRGLGQSIVRLSPSDGLTAGHPLTVTVVFRPRYTFTVDPFEIALVARRIEDARSEVVFSAKHRMAEGQTVNEDEPVRVDTTFRIPADAPATSHRPRIQWRLEVSAGMPARLRRSIAVRVRPSTRRKRAH